MRELERVFAALLALLALAGVGVVTGAAVAERARLRAASSEREARRIGEYLIEQQIGGGAMGDVFLARHTLLRRPTAVKVLRADRMSAEDISRFEREVRVTATLSHPNTIAIYDYGRTDDGSFYYAMEYLAGIDLDSLVSDFGALPDARVIHLLRQACGALGEGHEAGVVHRDVKLANLYLCARGGIPDVLKVLDFGLVKTDDAARVTRASVIVGTPENMAPELFESAANAAPLTDIYALGCVGYALVTGHRPFEGSSLAELCNAHLGKPVASPSQRANRPVDPTLERVILACLAKRPAERPQSTRAIVALLERSPLARAWTRDDADAFWAAHRDRIDDLVRRRGQRADDGAA
jgi:serine/threonine protein kinase